MDFGISEWIFCISEWIFAFQTDFWISEWISRFQIGFLDFKLDFCRLCTRFHSGDGPLGFRNSAGEAIDLFLGVWLHSWQLLFRKGKQSNTQSRETGVMKMEGKLFTYTSAWSHAYSCLRGGTGRFKSLCLGKKNRSSLGTR